jgi:formate hydrogenlyase transcriptional activator
MNRGMISSSPGCVGSSGTAAAHPLPFKPSEQVFRGLFESAPGGLLVLDKSGRILLVNHQIANLFGYSDSEIAGRSFTMLLPDRFRDVALKPKSGEVVYGSEIGLAGLRRNGTEFQIEMRIAAIGDCLFSCAIRDIRQHRVTEYLVQSQLAFEKLMSQLSKVFLRHTSDIEEPQIEEGLRWVVEELDLDRSCVTEIDPVSRRFVSVHSWVRPGFPNAELEGFDEKCPWLVSQLTSQMECKITTPVELPEEATKDRQYMDSVGWKSLLALPLWNKSEIIGLVSFNSFRHYQEWPQEFVARLQQIADVFSNVLARKRANAELHSAHAKISKLNERLEQENVYLREEIKLGHSHSSVVGQSTAIRSVLKQVEQVGPTDSAVLIVGETGTGKELIARTIHDVSRRRDRSMVKINCAALPPTLIESELFGREKGAYTGALSREMGRFELADRSTIFLDEISELPLDLQVKLLRVLQEGEFERLGSSRTLHVDVRLVAATNRNLAEAVSEGKFRADLFYRLNVFPIHIPPLRERPEDIPALTWHILSDLGKRMGKTVERIQAATLKAFQDYSWPGNVRELRNIVERNLILHNGSVFRARIPDSDGATTSVGSTLNEVERNHIVRVLQSKGWRVRGQKGAAAILGLKPTTLEYRMKKLNIVRKA